VGSQLENLGKAGGPWIALVANDSRVLVLDSHRPLGSGEEHGDGLENVERLEAGRHQRLAVSLRHEAIWPVAYDRRHVAGPRKPSRRRSGDSEIALIGGRS
jgi:hypothetical protein